MRAFSPLRGILSRRSAVSSVHPVARAAAYAVDLLERRTLLSSISGMVWQDDNADGYHDAMESGVSGIQVYDDVSGQSATTDSAGHYQIDDVDPQTCHVIRAGVPGGWRQTAGGGSVYFTGDDTVVGFTDFGLAQDGTVSGQRRETGGVKRGRKA